MPVQLPAVPGVLQDRLNVQIVAPQDPPTQADVGLAARFKYQATIAESRKEISIEALGAITTYEQNVTTAHAAEQAPENALTIDNIRRILRAELDNKLSPIEARINKKLDAMKTDLERKLGKVTALAAKTHNAQLGSGKVTPFEDVPFPDGTLPGERLTDTDAIRRLSRARCGEYYRKYTGKTGNLPSEAEQLDGIRLAIGCTVPIA
ncbi:hypothetical protein B0H14DRAFT_2749897 [Mycena olivaceomarginata]|nr:hypothetical protein B0H14DRAFT_2749897 [Mycena olivaceomarginata]